MGPVGGLVPGRGGRTQPAQGHPAAQVPHGRPHRELLPALPALVRSVNTRRAAAHTVLSTARGTEPGQTFTAGGTSLIRSTVARGAGDLVWPEDPSPRKRRNLSREEGRAFWAWAVVGSCAARLRPPALW